MTDGRVRIVGIVVLLCLFLGMCVWAGTIEGDPYYAGNQELIEEYDAYIGHEAEIGGEVVGTDPVVLEIGYADEVLELTVTNVDEPMTEGDNLRVFGTVEPGHTIEAQTGIVQQPWEFWYVHGISVLGGLWVLGRFLNRWRFDRSTLAFVPRRTTLLTEFDGGPFDG